jgi:hypothetical protein
VMKFVSVYTYCTKICPFFSIENMVANCAKGHGGGGEEGQIINKNSTSVDSLVELTLKSPTSFADDCKSCKKTFRNSTPVLLCVS